MQWLLLADLAASPLRSALGAERQAFAIVSVAESPRKQLLLRREMPESACDPDDADVVGTNAPGDEQERTEIDR